MKKVGAGRKWVYIEGLGVGSKRSCDQKDEELGGSEMDECHVMCCLEDWTE